MDDYVYARKEMPDGRLAVVFPITFGRARLAIGQKDVLWYDDLW